MISPINVFLIFIALIIIYAIFWELKLRTNKDEDDDYNYEKKYKYKDIETDEKISKSKTKKKKFRFLDKLIIMFVIAKVILLIVGE